jgi:hypothetical protein
MATKEEIEARHLLAVQAFVLRARRVRAHSLASDMKKLFELQKPKFVVHLNPATGEQRVTIPIPDEEQVESAAARLRPLLLEREAAYHGKVMAALLYFARKDSAPDEYVRRLRNLQKLWGAIKPNGKNLRFYEVHQQQGDEEATRVSDNELAFAWIYGDVVHADAERRAATERYGVLERFRAAVPVVAIFMLHTIYTLGLIESLVKSGNLPDLGDVFDQEVVVTESELAVETTVYVAEYDPANGPPKAPAMDEPFGEGWKPFTEVFSDIEQPTHEPSSD